MIAGTLKATMFQTAAHKKTYERTREALHALFGEVNVTPLDDLLVLQEGSTFVYVRVVGVGAQKTVVEVFSYVAIDVEVSEALMRYLLTHNLKLVLGGFALSIGGDGKGTVLLSHAMLGETLTKEELYASVSAVARVADEVDDRLVKEFGGTTALDKLNTPSAPLEIWE